MLGDPALSPAATFSDFARLTVKHAEATYGQSSREAQAVQGGWETVKVPL